MAIRKCPECKDPNFDDGACGCGLCKQCGWRQTCFHGGWYEPAPPMPPVLPPMSPGLISDRPLSTQDLGRAGAAIEASAHKDTLKLLSRAQKILRKIDDLIEDEEDSHPLVKIQLQEIEPFLRDLRDQRPILEQEPYEETGFGD